SKQVLELRKYCRPGAVDLLQPPLVPGDDMQCRTLHFYRRHPRKGGSHDQLPREYRACGRGRLTSDDLSENPARESLNGLHRQLSMIPASASSISHSAFTIHSS